MQFSFNHFYKGFRKWSKFPIKLHQVRLMTGCFVLSRRMSCFLCSIALAKYSEYLFSIRLWSLSCQFALSGAGSPSSSFSIFWWRLGAQQIGIRAGCGNIYKVKTRELTAKKIPFSSLGNPFSLRFVPLIWSHALIKSHLETLITLYSRSVVCQLSSCNISMAITCHWRFIIMSCTMYHLCVQSCSLHLGTLPAYGLHCNLHATRMFRTFCLL